MSHLLSRLAVGVFALTLLISVAPQAHAALTESQIQSILGLLTSFGADQSAINNVNASLRGQTPSITPGTSFTPNDNERNQSAVSSCPSLTRTLARTNTDVGTNGEVSQLQGFLTDYFNLGDAINSGYFGVLTEKYVKQFQAQNGIDQVGYVGSFTRSAIARACANNTSSQTGQVIPNATPTTPSTTYTPPSTATNAKSNLIPDTLKIVYPSSDTAIGVGQKLLIIYSVGSNIVASDPAIVERKIVNAGTDTSASGYVPVSVSGGTYTFDWTPNQAGKYQVVLNITHNNTTYPARSGVITVGNPITPAPTNTSPSVTFSYISSGNVIGSFANLPANSQIRFVSAATGQPYYSQSTMVYGGGSGPLSITIPNELPGGTYYLRVTDYNNPNTTIAQSSSFQAGANVQTNSVVINMFTASPTTINAGQAVMFMWGSNLNFTDTSYYGGGCSIEGLTQNNVALQVTPGFVSGGTVTYVPPATATYKLRCSSGAKDGSPSATKQITVNVGQPQTNPVVISSFTPSQTSVTSGQPVTFSWNSNLTSNDMSYYGGFCSISALTSYNQQIHITNGAGASGSVTYIPALTATYTLMCSAGGKNGSPMATKQVTVPVN